jgi:hypothetical protein
MICFSDTTLELLIEQMDCFQQHLALLAYAKMGMIVYDVDPKISKVEDIRAFLKASDCKMIVFPPVTETQDNLRLLRYSIPELFDCELKSFQVHILRHLTAKSYQIHIIIILSVNTNFPQMSYASSQIQTISDSISAQNISKTSDTLSTPVLISKSVRTACNRNSLLLSLLIFPSGFVADALPLLSPPPLLSPSSPPSTLSLGAMTFKSMFFMDPVTSRIDTEFKSNGEDLPFYSRISRGE